MLGKCYSFTGIKFNVICLAGGAGSRMGNQSDFIPKALSKIGNRRSIDYVIDRYEGVAHKFIIGTSYHSDLLQSYVKGRYSNFKNIDFSFEVPNDLKNNAVSTMYCLDLADSRYPTIVVFCDLLLLGNFNVSLDSFLLASNTTQGQIGNFRHFYDMKEHKFVINSEPLKPTKTNLGVMGCFVFEDTILLKSKVYSNKNLQDLTEDVVMEYHKDKKLKGEICEKVIEFGTEIDLQKAREIWESTI